MQQRYGAYMWLHLIPECKIKDLKCTIPTTHFQVVQEKKNVKGEGKKGGREECVCIQASTHTQRWQTQ